MNWDSLLSTQSSDNKYIKNSQPKCVVHFLPAMAGDCFVVELDNKNCILIDCGYSVTYKEELKPLLMKLSRKGCKISLMLITHIDEDHVSGAVNFVEENGYAEDPQIIQIDRIWHNGILNVIINSSWFLQHEKENVPDDTLKSWEKARGLLKKQLQGECGTISALQSKTFEEMCIRNHYIINEGVKNGCIVKNQKFQFDGCEIEILSPGVSEIEDFQKKMNKEMIRAFGKNYLWNRTNEFTEFLELAALNWGADIQGAFCDREISANAGNVENWLGSSSLAKMNEINRASIVAVIRYKGLSLLFMGDSESELWKKQLDPYYDLIKVAHHGSTRPNLAWMEYTRAGKLLISTNGGRYRHPEDDFLARAMMGDFKELYFNYDIQRKSVILAMQEKYCFKANFKTKEIPLN